MIYFDNNATTRVAPEVLESMMPFFGEEFGNPSSIHAAGRAARTAVENAREQVARLIGCASPGQILFTSCGTESDNLAILGSLRSQPGKNHIITTTVEHEAVKKVCAGLESEGFRVSWVQVDDDGSPNIDGLKSELTDETAIVSVMMANNETGVRMPIEEIGALVKARSNALFHVDAVNAAGKVPIDLTDSTVDLLSLSGHKFNGPKGIGALYIRDGIKLQPVIVGGGQESGRRAGTEAVHQIVGMGAAARLSCSLATMDSVRIMRDRLEEGILESIPNSYLNGTPNPTMRLPNTTNISFEHTNGEAILARLDSVGICVSTGSACGAADHRSSTVLEAMGIPYSRAMGSIRFSLGRYNTLVEVDRCLAALPEIVSSLRRLSTV
ncbi:MAG: aminotransferase class V-fold PLP-dependent enzyme [Pyrinomonadaceae bacterium]